MFNIWTTLPSSTVVEDSLWLKKVCQRIIDFSCYWSIVWIYCKVFWSLFGTAWKLPWLKFVQLIFLWCVWLCANCIQTTSVELRSRSCKYTGGALPHVTPLGPPRDSLANNFCSFSHPPFFRMFCPSQQAEIEGNMSDQCHPIKLNVKLYYYADVFGNKLYRYWSIKHHSIWRHKS